MKILEDKLKFGNEQFTKYDERDLREILDPLNELKRALKDNNIDVYNELNFVSKRTIQSVLAGDRSVKGIGDQVRFSPRWEVYFRKILDREVALISKKQQVKNAVEKLFFSVYRLLDEDIVYGLELIDIALEKCQKYELDGYLIHLEKIKKIFLDTIEK